MTDTTSAKARANALALLAGRQRLTGKCPIILRSEPVEQLTQARVALLEAEAAAQAAAGGDGEDPAKATLTAARKAERDAQQAVDDATLTLEFEGLAPETFRALRDLEEHQPTEEQKAKAEQLGLDTPWYNPTTFPAALIAATCTFPGFESPAEAAAYTTGPEARLSEPEADQVFEVALAVCVGARQVTDWGKGSGETAD